MVMLSEIGMLERRQLTGTVCDTECLQKKILQVLFKYLVQKIMPKARVITPCFIA